MQALCILNTFGKFHRNFWQWRKIATKTVYIASFDFSKLLPLSRFWQRNFQKKNRKSSSIIVTCFCNPLIFKFQWIKDLFWNIFWKISADRWYQLSTKHQSSSDNMNIPIKIFNWRNSHKMAILARTCFSGFCCICWKVLKRKLFCSSKTSKNFIQKVYPKWILPRAIVPGAGVLSTSRCILLNQGCSQKKETFSLFPNCGNKNLVRIRDDP